MSKTMVVTDRQYEWFTARARGGRTMQTVIDQIIKAIDRYEKDLAKYQAWVKASAEISEKRELT